MLKKIAYSRATHATRLSAFNHNAIATLTLFCLLELVAPSETAQVAFATLKEDAWRLVRINLTLTLDLLNHKGDNTSESSQNPLIFVLISLGAAAVLLVAFILYRRHRNRNARYGMEEPPAPVYEMTNL